jgi:hypothetical protein
VPGAINTLAFGLTFTGYTDSLRELLNNLAKFDLPFVVRSIEVERPQVVARLRKCLPVTISMLFLESLAVALIRT